MSKFHISKDGIARKCTAKGVCPLGGDEVHFATKEEAQDASDKKNESEHGILGGIQHGEKEEASRMSDALTNFLTVNRRGLVFYYEDKKGFDNIKDKLEESKVFITDLDEINEEEEEMLESIYSNLTSRRTRAITGFLNDPDENATYSTSKKENKTNLEGTFDEVMPVLVMFSSLGAERSSTAAKSSEISAFNNMTDKTALDTALKVIKKSDENIVGADLTLSGIVGEVQVLRSHGYSPEDIVELSKTTKLDDYIYSKFNVRPRDRAGATEMTSALLVSHGIKAESGSRGRANAREVLNDTIWNKRK